jgi:hypothetical protein
MNVELMKVELMNVELMGVELIGVKLIVRSCSEMICACFANFAGLALDRG